MSDELLIKRSAVFSECCTWRYTLVREWDSSLPRVLFILLNPSTADTTNDDATNRRGISYAMDWGYGSCVFCNLFAYRTPYPAVMKLAEDPVGPDNDRHLREQYDMADLVVAAWGVHGTYQDRNQQVAVMFDNLQCLRTTKDGHPYHILYLLKSLKPKKWEYVKISKGKIVKHKKICPECSEAVAIKNRQWEEKLTELRTRIKKLEKQKRESVR